MKHKMNDVDKIELEYLARIAKAMKTKKLTATALSRKMGVAHSLVFSLLGGATAVTFEKAHLLADALGLEFYPQLRKKRKGKSVKKPH